MAEVLDLSLLRDFMKKELLKAIDSVPKPKVLVVDHSLVCLLQSVLETDNLTKTLSEKSVSDVFTLEPESPPADPRTHNRIYLVRPAIGSMKYIARHARLFQRGESTRLMSIYLVPRKTLVPELVLEDYDVRCRPGSIELKELDLDIYAYEPDLLTMDIPHCFRELSVDGDFSSLYCIARSLLKLQSIYGAIPHIRGKGRWACKVAGIMERLKLENGDAAISYQTPEIDSLYIIDREVDLVTPMLTQLTYEGLIDEMFGLENREFYPPFEVKERKDSAGVQHSVRLTDTDTIFMDVRDLNFASVGSRLNKRARWVGERYDARKDLEKLSDMAQYMRNLPKLQEEHRNLGMHINIAHEIQKTTNGTLFRESVKMQQDILEGDEEKKTLEYIEDCIFQAEPLAKVMRLLSLFSLANGGLKEKQYTAFKTALIQNYGVQALLMLENVEKAGLFKRGEGRNNFATLRKTLKLTTSHESEVADDVSYVYSGYAPISVRLLEMATSGKIKGWTTMEPILQQLPGPIYPPNGESEPPPEMVPGAVRVVMIFFVGGCTLAEVSAIRLLKDLTSARDQAEGYQTHYIVGTTGLINGTTLMGSLDGR